MSKRYAESVKLVESNKEYDIKEALDVIEKMPKTKFDQTVELHVKLGVDSKHADQQQQHKKQLMELQRKIGEVDVLHLQTLFHHQQELQKQ